MSDTCICGDVEDEHGGDPNYPGSTACTVPGCDCLCFEIDGSCEDGTCDDDDCDCRQDPFKVDESDEVFDG